MNSRIPPRLRAPARLTLGALVVLAIGGAAHGWNTLIDVVPVVLVLIAGLYVWGGRDTDTGALIRREVDERQAAERLRVQALVGRVLSLAVAIAYLAASISRVTLWPWAALLGLAVGTFVVGRLAYGERPWRTPPEQ